MREQVAAADGGPASSRLGQFSWALFEGARNPYVLLVTIYIFAPYFAVHLAGDPARGQALWGDLSSLTGFLIALSAPVFGAIADQTGHRKRWVFVSMLVLAAASFLLWFAEADGTGLSLFEVSLLIIVCGLVFEINAVFHNAMLASVAPHDRVATLSGWALALGNASGVVLLLLMLAGLALPGVVDWPFVADAPWFGADPALHEPERLAGPISAVWFLVFAMPLFLFAGDRAGDVQSVGEAVSRGLRQLRRTIRSLSHYRNVATYLLARMLYTDGKTAVLVFGGIYAAGTFHWEPLQMLVYGVVLSIFATLGGFIGGFLDNVFGSRRAIFISIGGTAIGLVLSLSMTPTEILFFIPYDPATSPKLHDLPFFQTLPEVLYVLVVILIAIFITAAYANSRTMLARIAPVSRMTEFFGLYALSGTATAFLSPFVVSRVTEAFESQRAGMVAILAFLIGGFVLMFSVREERAKDAG